MIDSDKKLDDLKAALSNIDIGQDKPTKPDWLSNLETWSLDKLDTIISTQTWSLDSSQLTALTTAQIPAITISQTPNVALGTGIYTIGGGGGAGGSGAVIYGATGNPSTKINLTGDDADITVNGRSIIDMLENIEQRLAILQPNKDLESEWDELKALGDQYRVLEARIKDQIKTYETLKKMPKPDGF